MQVNYGEPELRSVLQKAKIFNKNIGEYQMFAITANFDYAVKLSNGTIAIKIEDLQDDSSDSLTPERLQTIASRFVSSSASTNTNSETTSKTNIVTDPPKQKKSKAGLIVTIVVLVILLGIGGLYVANNMNTGGGGSGMESYQERVMTIEETEKANPAQFLDAGGTYNENFWGDKMKLKVEVTNNATVATYKDVVIEVIFFTETDTELDRKRYVLYDVFPPTSKKTLDIKIETINNCKKLGWSAVTATPI